MTTTAPTAAPDDVRQYLQQLMAARSIPGLQIAVVRGGEVVLQDTMGLANVEHQVSVTDQSVFSINSMAKAFTGIAVMQLVEAGQVDLAAPISTYLDDLPSHWQAITVLQLATLTAGVPEIMVYTADSSVALIGDGSVAGAWAAAYAAPMAYPVGEGYGYIQTDYALLGRIIDRVSGMPFVEFIAQRQFAVAGMANTHYVNDCDVLPNRANTYTSISVDGEPAARVTNSHINWPPILRTAAGLHSTAEDLAGWVIALQKGRLLTQPSSIARMFATETLHDGRPGVWGIGWHIGRSAIAGLVPAPGGGAKAQVVLYPGGLGLVLLTNLLGAFPEHLAPVSGNSIDLGFIDPIARLYGV